MADWPDPDDQFGFQTFAQARTTLLEKIDAKDINGDPVHPLQFEEVFPPGTWVIADCTPFMYVFISPCYSQNVMLSIDGICHVRCIPVVHINFA